MPADVDPWDEIDRQMLELDRERAAMWDEMIGIVRDLAEQDRLESDAGRELMRRAREALAHWDRLRGTPSLRHSEPRAYEPVIRRAHRRQQGRSRAPGRARPASRSRVGASGPKVGTRTAAGR